MPVLRYLEHVPELDGDISIAEDAYIIGKVTLQGPAVLDSSAVIRGDQAAISIEGGFHMGRGSTIHVDADNPTVIGQNVWLGEGTVAHGCRLGDTVRVENGGLVLSYANVGAGSIVTAGALVTEGAVFPPNSYIEGSPGRRTRDTTPEERDETRVRSPSRSKL